MFKKLWGQLQMRAPPKKNKIKLKKLKNLKFKRLKSCEANPPKNNNVKYIFFFFF